MVTPQENFKGVMLMMGSMAAFTLNDTLLKTVSHDLPLFQTVFIRGTMVTIGLLLIILIRGQFRLDFSRRDWGLIALRSIGEIGATVTFLIALFNMPLANVTAILQATPLTITLAGAVFLGEQVGWRRYMAILVGFGGVLMIVRPLGDGFNVYSLYVLGTLGFILLRDLPTRRLSREVPSLMVALSAAVVITTLGGLMTLTGEWEPVTAHAAYRISGAAVFILAGYVLAVTVMRVGEIAVVQPFRYTAILWAIALGYLVFGDIPDFWTVLGASIVVGMGIYTFYRERRAKRKLAA